MGVRDRVGVRERERVGVRERVVMVNFSQAGAVRARAPRPIGSRKSGPRCCEGLWRAAASHVPRAATEERMSQARRAGAPLLRGSVEACAEVLRRRIAHSMAYLTISQSRSRRGRTPIASGKL